MTVQAVESSRSACRVALRTGNIVYPLERERMLERRRCPCRSVVALLAVVGKAQSSMIRPERIIVRMTGVAIGSNGLEIPAGVAAYAIETAVSTAEREEIMLEIGGAPARGSMTPFAAGRPAISNMVG